MSKNSNALLQFSAILLPNSLASFFRFSTGLLLPGFETIYESNNVVGGLVVSLSFALSGIGIAFSGYFSSRYGERKVAQIGIAIFSASVALCTLFHSVLTFGILFGLGGFGTGLMTTPCYSMAAAVFPKRAGVATGLLSATFNLGAFVGPTVTGVLLVSYSWQVPFFVMSALGIIFLSFFSIGTRGYASSHKLGIASKSALKGLFNNPNLLIISAGMFLGDFAAYAYATWSPAYILSSFHLGNAALPTIGFYFGLGFGLGGLGVILAGYLFDKIGGRFASLIAGTACGLTSILFLFSPTVGVALAAFVAVGFFSNWFWGLLSTMSQSHVQNDARASAISIVQSSGLIGAALGPSSVGYLTGDTQLSQFPMIVTITLPYLIFTSLFLGRYSDSKLVRNVGQDKSEQVH